MTELSDPHIQVAVGAAREARELLGIGPSDPFERDLVACAEQEFGLSVCILDLPQELAGAYLRSGRRGTVFIQAANFPTRQRFTVAHELGHHLLGHGGVLESYDDVGRDTADPAEQQANYFASELLQSVDAVCAVMAELLEDGDPPDMIAIVRMAEHFHVSPLAMLYRLSKGEFPGVDRELLDELWDQAKGPKLHLQIAEELEVGHGRDELSRCYDAKSFPRLPSGLSEACDARITQLVRTAFLRAATDVDADERTNDLAQAQPGGEAQL